MQKSTKKILLISVLTVFYCCGAEKVLVNIERMVKEVDEATSCEVGEWANSLTAACKCCLIKRVPQLDKGQTALDIITECIEKKHCTLSIIDEIQKELGIDASDQNALEKQLRALYNKSLIIKKVPTEGIQFDQYGNFANEQSVALFLERAYKEGKLPFEAFKSANCLTIKNYSEAKGYQTLQLFTIDSVCGGKPEQFILKEIASRYTETRNLAHFYGMKQFDPFIMPAKKRSYPSLAIPLAFIQYGNHYLSLMPRAPGSSLASFMRDYIKNPDENTKKSLIQAYTDVIQKVAHFHQFFMPNKGNKGLENTIIHGDLHHQNIFYDPVTYKVTLIDNERMPSSLSNPQDPIKDIIYLLLITIEAEPLIPSEVRQLINKSQWLSLIAPLILKTYIKEYPVAQQSLLLAEIEKRIKRERSDLYQKYELEKIFKQILL